MIRDRVMKRWVSRLMKGIENPVSTAIWRERDDRPPIPAR